MYLCVFLYLVLVQVGFFGRKMKRYVVLDPRLVKSERIACEVAIAPFRNEILQYLQDLERSPASALNAVMIDNQPEIRWEMRPYIVDFLIELHLFFKLSQETLFLACFIADKYCSRRIVYRRHYQLLVATSLWIAAKYHEKKTRVPTLKELRLLCHQIYDSSMILQMEKHILTTLEWCVGNSVSAFDMVQCLLSTSSEQTIPENPQLIGLSHFLCDLTLYRRDFMSHSSSTKAITAVLLASQILNVGNFPDFLRESWLYAQDDGDDSFHMFGDQATNDISLSLSKCNVDDIRNCMQLFLNDIFDYPMGGQKESISNTLLRKYKRFPLEQWLNNYRSNNLQLYAHLSSLNESLKLAGLSPYSSSTSSFLRESVCSCLDELAGLKNIYKTDSDLNVSPSTKSQLNFSPYTPSSPFSTSDISALNRWNLPTPTSCRSSVTQLSFHNHSMSFTPGHTKSCTACPTTPTSANSVFSNAPRLSVTSRSSSFNSLHGVPTSNPTHLKTSCSRGSTLNVKRSNSAQDNVPSIYEFSFT